MGARPQRPAAHWVAKASLPVRRAASAVVRRSELRACSAASAIESQRSRVTPRVRAPVVGMSPKSACLAGNLRRRACKCGFARAKVVVEACVTATPSTLRRRWTARRGTRQKRTGAEAKPKLRPSMVKKTAAPVAGSTRQTTPNCG
eukprot:scaffold4496_cov128-Isochrysis_galbana.AAC.10